jgi:hypothetical protein
MHLSPPPGAEEERGRGQRLGRRQRALAAVLGVVAGLGQQEPGRGGHVGKAVGSRQGGKLASLENFYYTIASTTSTTILYCSYQVLNSNNYCSYIIY